MGTGQRGGKHPISGTKHELHPNTAGDVTEGLGGGNTTVRGFKGPGTSKYTYKRVIGGITFTKTFTAHSVAEADRIAESQGFKTSDREIERRKKKKRK